MNYLDILDDIINVLELDYSGIKEKYGLINRKSTLEDLSTRLKQETFNDFSFYLYINSLLNNYQDKHLFFNLVDNDKAKIMSCGFKYRRYENSLVITEISDMSATLAVGMRIIEIDGRSISEIESMSYKGMPECLNNPTKERWDVELLGSSKIMIKGLDDAEFEYQVAPQRLQAKELPYLFINYSSGIGIMKITDFFDSEKINEYLKQYEQDISRCSSIVIDIRDNPGGTDSAFFKLLEICLAGENTYSEIDNEEIEFNMTERNYSLRMPKLEMGLKNASDNISRNYYKNFINLMNDNRGMGFKTIDFYDYENNFKVKGLPNIKSVVLLIDSGCASSAESFVRVAKTSKRVTTIGRPTAGALDYCNLAEQRYENRFSFKYPTSRSKNIDIGLGINNVGIKPDILIPWNPQMLEKDIDLEVAISFIKDKG